MKEITVRIDVGPMMGKTLWGANPICALQDYLRFWCEERWTGKEDIAFSIGPVENDRVDVTLRGDERRVDRIAAWLDDWSKRGCQVMVFAMTTMPDRMLYRLYCSLDAVAADNPGVIDRNHLSLSIRTLRGAAG